MDKMKKAALFSVLALLLGGLFFFVLLPSTDTKLTKSVETASPRIEMIDGFIDDLDNYYREALKVSVRGAFDSMSDYIADNGFEDANMAACMIDAFAGQGFFWNFTYTSIETDDMAFSVNPGVAGTSLSVGNIYLSTDPAIIKFKARNTTVLDSVDVSLYYLDWTDQNWRFDAYILDDPCGFPGKVLSHSSNTLLPPQVTFFTFRANFSNGFKMYQGNDYYLLFTKQRIAPIVGNDFLLFGTDNLEELPESNTTFVTITEYAYSSMNQVSLYNFSDEVQQYAQDELKIDAKFQINNITFTQTQPWDVTAKLNITYLIEDSAASWEKTSIIETNVPIEGLRDPYFSFGGVMNRTISKNDSFLGVWDLKTPESNYSQGNFTLFETYYNQTFYIPSSRTPGFLMRFSNNTKGSNCCGIETLVNISYPEYENKSHIGYKYFAPEKFECDKDELWNITNDDDDIFQHFQLDKESVAYYGYNTGGDTTFSASSCG